MVCTRGTVAKLPHVGMTTTGINLSKVIPVPIRKFDRDINCPTSRGPASSSLDISPGFSRIKEKIQGAVAVEIGVVRRQNVAGPLLGSDDAVIGHRKLCHRNRLPVRSSLGGKSSGRKGHHHEQGQNHRKEFPHVFHKLCSFNFKMNFARLTENC